MHTVDATQHFARDLRDEIFGMRHGPELGPIEDPMPLDRLRPILAAKIGAAGVTLSDAQLDALVQHFPVIDVWPDDAYPNEAKVYEREAAALLKLLDHFVPELRSNLGK